MINSMEGAFIVKDQISNLDLWINMEEISTMGNGKMENDMAEENTFIVNQNE